MDSLLVASFPLVCLLCLIESSVTKNKSGFNISGSFFTYLSGVLHGTLGRNEG